MHGWPWVEDKSWEKRKEAVLTCVNSSVPGLELGQGDAVFALYHVASVSGRDEVELVAVGYDSRLGGGERRRGRRRCGD